MHPLLRGPYSAAASLANALAAVVPAGGGKIRQSLHARRECLARWESWAQRHRDPSRPLVWFHAPSVGEGLQARAVMELVRARRPQWQLAYSHFSPSAAPFARSVPADVADYLPFDTVSAASRMLDALRPSALVFGKLDVWPRLAEVASHRGVALGMVSATVAPGSGRLGRLAGALLRDAHAGFRRVGAISGEDAARLVGLGFPADAVRVTGDTRYDQVLARAARVDRTAGVVARLSSASPTLVAGSTWPGDEAVLCAAWPRVRASVPGARLIVAPHEPTSAHLEPIERWARDAGLNCQRLDGATPETEVVVVDRVGVLGDLYALATTAWVGGGFHAAGLHSVLEPAAYGAPVVFGPRHANSRDAGLLAACGGGAVVTDAASAADVLTRWLINGAEAGAAARTLVVDGAGASERSWELVCDLVGDPASAGRRPA